MDGPRRIELKTSDTVKQGASKATKLAVRFEITLEESTDERCPEISYADLLLKHEMKRQKNGSVPPGDDPFTDENSENLEALAKRLEEKYGKSYLPTAKNRYIDMGDGYDLDDSFIDNEEAYDEVVPLTLNTQHGGFYINCGMLDFKEVSDDEILSEGEVRQKIKKKKRVLSESDNRSVDSVARPAIKKKKSLSDSIKSTSLLKKKKFLNRDSLSREKLLKKKKFLQKKKLIEGSKLGLPAHELSRKIKQYDSVIDDVIKGSKGSEEKAGREKLEAKHDPPDEMNDQQESSDIKKESKEMKEAPKLPDNLSSACLSLVQELKNMAESSSGEKGKFFTNEVNNVLIGLDNEVQQITSYNTRNAVYSYLSTFMPINRETLMKRMKLLRQKQLSDKLQEPMQRLKAAIEEEMPAQVEQYNTELQQRQQCKQEDLEKLKEDSQESDDDGPAQFSSAGNESPSHPSQQGGDKKKAQTAPKFCKKFKWTEKIRSLLCEVITIKMECYDSMKVKGQTADEYLKEFLENEVRVLWPKGWMQSRVLYRESRLAHLKWTNPSQLAQTSKIAAVKKPALITNAIKMATNMTTVKKPLPVSNTVVKAPVDTTKCPVSSADIKIQTVTLNSANASVSSSSASISQSKASTPGQGELTTVIVSTKASVNTSPSSGKLTSLIGAKITNSGNGEKILMDGTRVIGKLVPTPTGAQRNVHSLSGVTLTTASAGQDVVSSSTQDVTPAVKSPRSQEPLTESIKTLSVPVIVPAAPVASHAKTTDKLSNKSPASHQDLQNQAQLIIARQKASPHQKQPTSVVIKSGQVMQQQQQQLAALHSTKIAEELVAAYQSITPRALDLSVDQAMIQQQNLVAKQQLTQQKLTQQHLQQKAAAQQQNQQIATMQQQQKQQIPTMQPQQKQQISTMQPQQKQQIASMQSQQKQQVITLTQQQKQQMAAITQQQQQQMAKLAQQYTAVHMTSSPQQVQIAGFHQSSPTSREQRVVYSVTSPLISRPTQSITSQPSASTVTTIPQMLSAYPSAYSSGSPALPNSQQISQASSQSVLPTSVWPAGLSPSSLTPAQLTEYMRNLESRARLDSMKK